MKRLIYQFIKFGLVGFVCFLFEYGLFAFLKEVCVVYYLIASALAFAASTILNYLLSMRFVFKSDNSRNKALLFIIYVILSIIGLGLNVVLMWFGGDILHINVYIVKLFATFAVLVYNFITRKLFIEQRKKSLG